MMSPWWCYKKTVTAHVRLTVNVFSQWLFYLPFFHFFFVCTQQMSVDVWFHSIFFLHRNLLNINDNDFRFFFFWNWHWKKLLIAYIQRVQQQHTNRHTQRDRKRAIPLSSHPWIDWRVYISTTCRMHIRLRIQKLSEFI